MYAESLWTCFAEKECSVGFSWEIYGYGIINETMMAILIC